MSVWQRLLNALGVHAPPEKSFQLDTDLIEWLQVLAEQEQRPEAEIAADLISSGLAQRDATQEFMRRWETLSPREQQVAVLICMNFTNRQIAQRLFISPETVKAHVRNILRKFGIHSKHELRVFLAGWDFSAWK